MTKVTLYRNNKGYIVRYKVLGHSGYDIKGKDIVCAAVSCLSQTVLIALVKVLNIPEADIDYSIDEDIGLLDVKIPLNMPYDKLEEVNIVLKTFEVGIKSIMESYPGYVTLSYEEV
ncbi:MAG: ribosomal-processing cysteine protease Prp [Tissierellia bacterium]|nr:ribosomal-processing cysteine protease Prp [Tissierellia bacterium]